MASAPGKAGWSWTPTSLAGKALGIFGGGAEQKKLKTVQSFFPHEDNTQIANIAEIYVDVLEYLRPGVYSDSVKRPIAKLLLAQIRAKNTRHLEDALHNLSLLEKQHFLSAIMIACIDGIENHYDALYWRSRDTILTTTTKEAKALVPTLQFIVQIAMQYDSTCRVVLKAGILDMILRIYVIFPTFSQSAVDGPEHWSPLLKACRSTLLVLSSSMNAGDISHHPVFSLWADCQPYPPAYTMELQSPADIVQARCTAWRKTPRSCVKRRLSIIYANSLWKSNVYEIEDIEACIDMVEFTRPSFYDADIVELAFLAMLKQIVLSRSSVRHLIHAIQQGPDKTHIFSGILQLWLECAHIQAVNSVAYGRGSHTEFAHNTIDRRLDVTLPIDVDENFYNREKTRLFERIAYVDSALYNVISFATDAARKDSILRGGLVEAGALSLIVVAFINDDFQASDLINFATKKAWSHEAMLTRRVNAGSEPHSLPPIPLKLIHHEASTLSVKIHKAAFRGFWRDQQLNERRHYCSLLVAALLGDFLGGDDKYAWTRSLFRKILT